MRSIYILLGSLFLIGVSYWAGHFKGKEDGRRIGELISSTRRSGEPSPAQTQTQANSNETQQAAPLDEKIIPPAPLQQASSEEIDTPPMKTEDLVAALSMVGAAIQAQTSDTAAPTALEKRAKETQVGDEQKAILDKFGSSNASDSLKTLFLASTIAAPGDPELPILYRQTARSLKANPIESGAALKKAFEAIPQEYSIQKRGILQMLKELPGQEANAQALCSGADRQQPYCAQ